MAAITSTGLGSGLDINGIVTKLIDAEQTPVIKRLDKQEVALQAKISAYGTFKSTYSSVQDSLSALGKLQTFQKMSAASSDGSVVTATASSNADPGTYKLEVRQMAQSQALATRAYDSADAPIGTGTLTIKFGKTETGSGYKFTQAPDKGTLTLNIDSTNNTLTGLRDAINQASAGVNASIIYSGSGYQLVLNGTDGGASSSMQVSAADNDGNNTDTNGLSAFAFNGEISHLTQTQAAQDAQVVINGLTVTSSSNTIGTALKGVSLNLQQAQVGKTVSLTVGQNEADVSAAISNFVGKFNELAKLVSSNTSYDSQKKTAGVLMGESAVYNSMTRLRAQIGSPVAGLTGAVRTLSDIGVATQKDGTLNFDAGKLAKAFAADRNSVAALFAVVGRPSDGSSIYLGSTKDTVAGRYAVNITRPATQAVLSGGAITAGFPLTVDESNDTFRIQVNGTQSGDIRLTQGSYASGADLAAEIQARINGDSTLKTGGAAVKVNFVDNRLQIQSVVYGSSSQVEIIQADSTSLATLGLGIMAGQPGLDMAGNIDDANNAKATLLGAVVSSLVVGSENDSLQIKVDGAQSGNVRLTQKTYASGIELAVELQTRINEDSSLKGAGVSVDVSFVNNRLQIQSSRPGGNSQLEITGVGSTMSSTLGISTARGVLTIPAATQGILSGDTISSFPQTVDAGNNSLRITVDGVASGKISLLDNSYASGEDLATELEKAINSDPTLQAGRAAVKVGFVNDQLQILSARYGADSQVQITQIGTEGSGVLGGLKVASGIAGTGIQGQGQVLTATGGNASGLSLLIDGSQTGSRGTVDFSRGAIEPLSTILSAALDVKGIIASRTDGINKSITNITRQRTDLSTRMETYQRQLYIRFNAMDSMMGKLQATSTYLTQQITALNAANKQN